MPGTINDYASLACKSLYCATDGESYGWVAYDEHVVEAIDPTSFAFIKSLFDNDEHELVFYVNWNWQQTSHPANPRLDHVHVIHHDHHLLSLDVLDNGTTVMYQWVTIPTDADLKPPKVVDNQTYIESDFAYLKSVARYVDLMMGLQFCKVEESHSMGGDTPLLTFTPRLYRSLVVSANYDGTMPEDHQLHIYDLEDVPDDWTTHELPLDSPPVAAGKIVAWLEIWRNANNT